MKILSLLLLLSLAVSNTFTGKVVKITDSDTLGLDMQQNAGRIVKLCCN